MRGQEHADRTPQTGQEFAEILGNLYNDLLEGVEKFYSNPNRKTFLDLVEHINGRFGSILKACDAAPPYIFAEPLIFDTILYPNPLCFLLSHSDFVARTIRRPISEAEILLGHNPRLIQDLQGSLVKKCISKLAADGADGSINSLRLALIFAIRLNSSEMPDLLKALGIHALTCVDHSMGLPIPPNVDLVFNPYGDVPIYYPNPLAQLLTRNNSQGRECAIIDLIETLISHILDQPDQKDQLHLLLNMKCRYAGNTWTFRDLITDVINTDDVLREIFIAQLDDKDHSQEYFDLLKECFPNLILEAKYALLDIGRLLPEEDTSPKRKRGRPEEEEEDTLPKRKRGRYLPPTSLEDIRCIAHYSRTNTNGL